MSKICSKIKFNMKKSISLDDLMSVIPNVPSFPKNFEKVRVYVDDGDIVVDWTLLQNEYYNTLSN
jgi:hypothetical protein